MLLSRVKRDGQPRQVLWTFTYSPNSEFSSGIIPRDGKNIKFSDMPHKLNATYNFAPSFTFFVPNLAANMLKKNFYKDTFDLSDLDLHNGIEHDASLTRTH